MIFLILVDFFAWESISDALKMYCRYTKKHYICRLKYAPFWCVDKYND